jgi:TetR/AcrR family transcriptional regulator, transcriptional repressor for nem operon
MRNPDITRENILNKAGRLFNTQGYKATSLGDITELTGLTKGAIYRHFKSKERLEAETLEYLAGLMFAKERVRVKAEKTAPAKLRAVFRFFESYISHPPVHGGCPLMNAAVEADDTNPKLRKQAVEILYVLRKSIAAIIDNGIRHGQLKKATDRDFYSTIIIASLEGAIMMGKLEGNNTDIRRVVRHLNKLIAEIEV